jgi:hypothetical protein
MSSPGPIEIGRGPCEDIWNQCNRLAGGPCSATAAVSMVARGLAESTAIAKGRPGTNGNWTDQKQIIQESSTATLSSPSPLHKQMSLKPMPYSCGALLPHISNIFPKGGSTCAGLAKLRTGAACCPRARNTSTHETRPRLELGGPAQRTHTPARIVL